MPPKKQPEGYLAIDIVQRQINVPLDVALDEIRFWGHQLSEHVLFVTDALSRTFADESIKQRGMQLYQQWRAYLNGLFGPVHPSVPRPLLSQVLLLIEAVRDYQVELWQRIKSGQWIGYDYPSLLRHHLDEAMYFLRKLTGPVLTAEEEVAFWNMVNGDHAAVTAHLLDPSELKSVMEQGTIANEFYLVNGRLISGADLREVIELSLALQHQYGQQSQALRPLLESQEIENVINPLLLDHVMRENERGRMILSQL